MRPTRIAIYIFAVIALLGLISFLYPADGLSVGDYQLRWRTLSDVLELEEVNHGEGVNIGEIPTFADNQYPIPDSLPEASDTPSPIPNSAASNTPYPISNSLPEASNNPKSALADFFASLSNASNQAIRIVHYGDSQIEEDRITSILRQQFQEHFGGGGPGLLPLHQTIPTRTMRQRLTMNGVVQSVQGGPKRYLVYGPRSMRLEEGDDDYGVMGQVALMDSSLVAGSHQLQLQIQPFDKKLTAANRFNRLRLLASSSITPSPISDSLPEASDIHALRDTTALTLTLQGQGRVYGISLESDTGVIVDNIPMRGCSGNIFTRIDSAQLASFFRETHTRLIILQFGGNMIPHTENQSTIYGYVRTTMRQQVRYLRACAPEASILFIGPSDMSTNIDGQMTTYPLVPYMDKLLRQMAKEEEIAYWSIYEAMGGYNSMVAWHDKGLAGSDYVHFTRAGANKIGRQLYQWLDAQYSDYLASQPASSPDSLIAAQPDSVAILAAGDSVLVCDSVHATE